jgi:hypothetical protein
LHRFERKWIKTDGEDITWVLCKRKAGRKRGVIQSWDEEWWNVECIEGHESRCDALNITRCSDVSFKKGSMDVRDSEKPIDEYSTYHMCMLLTHVKDLYLPPCRRSDGSLLSSASLGFKIVSGGGAV